MSVVAKQTSLELCGIGWVSSNYPVLSKLEEMKCPFTQLTRRIFFCKAGNERFTAAGLRCRQNLKYENFTSLLGRLRQNIASKSMLHVQIFFIQPFICGVVVDVAVVKS